MKKSLLAMLLAVIMVAAVIFIAAPATKAETVEADITLSADTTETLVIDSDKVLNLNGFNATVSVNKGVTLTIVDTKFMEGNWNLDGTSAGTLTVAEGSEGTIKAWEQFGDYKYLAVKNGNTYSAHPFNIMLTNVGVNTHSSKITVGITVIADNVVANLIDAGEFGLHNHTLELEKNRNHPEYENRYAKHFAKFNGKNGLQVYFDLNNSLSKDVLTENRSNEFGAYIKVNAGNGDLIIDSFSQTGVSPLEILTAVNNNASNYTPEQKTKMVEMLAKEENAHLKEYCGNFLIPEPIEATLTFDNTEKRIDGSSSKQVWTENGVTVTNEGNVNIEYYAPVRFYKNSTVTVEFAGMTKITFACNTKAYATALASAITNYDVIVNEKSVTVLFKEATDSFTATMSVDQVRVDSITVSTAPVHEHTYDNGVVTAPTCTEKGYTTYACVDCGHNYTDNEVAANGHSYTAVVTAPTCGADGYTTYTCTNANCGDSYTSDKKPATGKHTYVEGVCSVCGAKEESTENPEPIAPSWTKTDLANIKATDVVVIVWTTKDGTVYAMTNSNGTGSAPAAVKVTVEGNKLTGTIADNIKWNITNNSGNLTIYPNGNTAKWLYCTNTNNGVRVGTNANKVFTIDATSGYLKNTATSRYVGVYTTTPDVRCYTSSTATNIKDQTLAFYVYNPGTSGGETPDTPETPVCENEKCATCQGCLNSQCTICEAVCPGHASGNPTWQKADSIAVGDVVTLVYETGKKELSSISSYGTGVAYTSAPAGVMKLTVVAGSTAGTYAFKTEDGKYLYWSSSNSLNLNATLSVNTSWKVTFSGGNVIIQNAKDNARKIQWNASSPRFACYTSAQTAIQLYVYK